MRFFETLKFFLPQIELQTSATVSKPGEELDISISTSPNSFVGLLGVDQSVLVLKKGNDIEVSSVFDDLESYGKANKMNHKWVSGYESIMYKDFDASEMFLITNAKKEFGEIIVFSLLLKFFKFLCPQSPKAFHYFINVVMECLAAEAVASEVASRWLLG